MKPEPVPEPVPERSARYLAAADAALGAGDRCTARLLLSAVTMHNRYAR